jgi:hypothetical protein
LGTRWCWILATLRMEVGLHVSSCISLLWRYIYALWNSGSRVFQALGLLQFLILYILGLLGYIYPLFTLYGPIRNQILKNRYGSNQIDKTWRKFRSGGNKRYCLPVVRCIVAVRFLLLRKYRNYRNLLYLPWWPKLRSHLGLDSSYNSIIGNNNWFCLKFGGYWIELNNLDYCYSSALHVKQLHLDHLH